MKEIIPIYRATTRINVAGPFRIPSAMYVIKDGEDVVLIDPFTLPESETKELEALGVPTLILITGRLHVRDADAYRKRYGAKILANREAVPELGIGVDDAFGDGETLPGGLTTIEMPGTIPGETILRREQGKGVLIVGDALWNLRLSECGLILGLFMRLLGWPEGFGAMPKLLMANDKLATESYQKLLDYDFDQILVSHGQPILRDAKEMLRVALEKQ